MIIDNIIDLMYGWNALINKHAWVGIFTIFLLLILILVITFFGETMLEYTEKYLKIAFLIAIPICILGFIFDIKDMKYLPMAFIILGLPLFFSEGLMETKRKC